MIKNIFLYCLTPFLLAFAINPTVFAQSWIPEDIDKNTILIERYNYQDPNNTLDDIDEMYEDQRDDFVEDFNEQLKKYNTKLEGLFKAYKHPYELAVASKIKEKYEDKKKFRYILKRDLFFGKKKVYSTKAKKTEDKSYFAHRYYFYDRVEDKKYPYYYFSGDQWLQAKRLIYWLNKKSKK